MLIISNNKIIVDPLELNDLSKKDIDSILKKNAEHPLMFLMPDIDFERFKYLNENMNIAKRIFKVGFLNEIYSILYPNYTRAKAMETIAFRYDLFINKRQFEKDVKVYSDKKNHIFV